MANQYKNKVVYNGTTLIDLSDTTAVQSDVASGKFFYLATGEKAEGTASGGGGGGSTRTTIVPEQTANYTERYNQINFIAPLVIGEVYIYTIDGVESQSTAFDNYGTVGLGSPDTTIGFDYGNGVMYLSIADTSLRTTHTIKIEQESEGGGGSATLITKTITANGTYSAEDDDADGYSEVTVNVPSGGVSITDGIVVTARDSNGYATAVDFYGTVVQPKQFYNRIVSDGGWINLSAISFKSGVIEIKSSSFYACGNLTTIDLSSVETIGGSAFQDCRALSLVTASELTSCGASAFIGCTSLQTFVAPKLRNCNTSRALRGCTALTTVQLGSIGYDVTSIHNYLFEQDTQTGLTITVYTKGSYVNTAVTNVRKGATNATIVIKASEATTYNGTSYAAGDTIVTSTP